MDKYKFFWAVLFLLGFLAGGVLLEWVSINLYNELPNPNEVYFYMGGLLIALLLMMARPESQSQEKEKLNTEDGGKTK